MRGVAGALTSSNQCSVSYAAQIYKLCEVKMESEITKFSHSVGQNSYHFVWKPKWSWDIFKFPWVKNDCEAILRDTAGRHKIKIYQLEVMSDHIHLFAEVPPTMSVSKAFQLLKGNSAYALFRKQPWLRNYFKTGHLWSPGKFFRSVGNVTAKTVAQYIAQSNGNWKNQDLLTRYP